MHVCWPPFLTLWPLADDTTTGLRFLGVIIVGAWPNAAAGDAAATAAAVVARTNSRRLISVMADLLVVVPGLPARVRRLSLRQPRLERAHFLERNGQPAISRRPIAARAKAGQH